MQRLPAGDGVQPSASESQRCVWDDAAALRGLTSEEAARERPVCGDASRDREGWKKRGRKQHRVVSARRLRWHFGADVSDSVASGAQTQTAEKNGR